jgi:hypothetical protein
VDLKKLFLLACLCVVATLGAASRPAAKKGDPMAADTWRASPTSFENKEVKTAVLEVVDFGVTTSDDPASAVRIQTGNSQDETGGSIIVLMPPEKFSDFIANFSSREMGGNRSGFGALSHAKTFSATYVTIQGEGVLVYNLDPKVAKTLSKPSVLLQNQLKAEKSAVATTTSARPGWKQQEFNVAQIGKPGASETAREWDRLQGLLAQQTAKEKQPRWKTKELQDALKDGRNVIVNDESAKVEWTLVWR